MNKQTEMGLQAAAATGKTLIIDSTECAVYARPHTYLPDTDDAPGYMICPEGTKIKIILSPLSHQMSITNHATSKFVLTGKNQTYKACPDTLEDILRVALDTAKSLEKGE